jgi:ATP-dependent DNA helicase RecQ
MDLRAALHHHFIFPEFRPGQQEALTHILEGRDALVVMPTGSGKSLIYQLAALSLDGAALVISPLVALMKDQIDSLIKRNIAATFINSSLSTAEQNKRLQSFANGEYKMILVAPERLRQQTFRDVLAQTKISLLAIDEAHCLSQWGHDFRPDYLHIAHARRQLNSPITLALTATATPRVQDDIIQLLGLPHAERVITGFNRPNLFFEVFAARDDAAKLNLTRDFLHQAEGAGIIYVGTRRDAENVAAYIRDELKLSAQHYHAALDSAQRTQTQDAFLSGDLPLIVATNAFGMGIDRPDVRFVLHYTLPSTLEAYYQEAGRAGRDGLPARVAMLYSPNDTRLHSFFIENDSPTDDELRAVHNFLRGPIQGVAATEIEAATQLHQTKVRVALEQLESIHAIKRDPDVSGFLQIEALPLNEKSFQQLATQVAARRKYKYALLDKVVDYAETNACRRHVLLDHFGDKDKSEVSPQECCDNCIERAEAASALQPSTPAVNDVASLSQAERGALIVLDTAAKLKPEVGKGKLAQILKGSTSSEIERYKNSRNFGKFISLRLGEIESLVDQLMDAGYLKQTGGKYPVLTLTPRGEIALKTRAAIRVDLRQVRAAESDRARAKMRAGGTVALTFETLQRGLNVEQIAAERGLAVGTIYSHLAQLIAEGRVNIDAVVAKDIQDQIRAVIEKIGAIEYISPIKFQLPDSISYSEIRCVVEAWRREKTSQISEVAHTAKTSEISGA